MTSPQFFLDCIQAQIDVDRALYEANGYEYTSHTSNEPTIGDIVRAILAIKHLSDALHFYHSYTNWLRSRSQTSQYTPEQVASSNIYFCFGEGMGPEKMNMWRWVLNLNQFIQA